MHKCFLKFHFLLLHKFVFKLMVMTHDHDRSIYNSSPIFLFLQNLKHINKKIAVILEYLFSYA